MEGHEVSTEHATATNRAADQQDLVDQLVHGVTESWSKTFDRPELLRYNQLPNRLDGVVHSVLVQLDGDGGVQPHRLSPKGTNVDLFAGEGSPRYAYPPTDDTDGETPAETLAFINALWSIRNRVVDAVPTTSDAVTRFAVGSLLAELCELLEASYELVPQFFDDEGDHESESVDIAPGLTAAFKAEWAQTEAR